MATFRPFRAVRPLPELAAQVAALPYDTMSSAEARKRAAGNPHTFLHIDKAEIDLPEGTGLYDDIVYATAAANLARARQNGVFAQDAWAQYYIYRQTWRGRTQTGLVGCAAIDDYKNNIIKKHELTHPEKESDRIHHVTACNANTGPIFLLYRDEEGVAALLEQWTRQHPPESDFVADGGARQQLWPITDPALVARLQAAFAATPALYIADGHHRCASAYHVGVHRRQDAESRGEPLSGEEEFNFFLAVAFPAEQPAIMDYNRVVKDLNRLSSREFLTRIEDLFSVEHFASAGTPYRPAQAHHFGMFLEGQWYHLRARQGTFDAHDPVGCLDVSILQENLLAPILGIKDPRRDHRIEFIGGIRGPEELERRCDPAANDMCVAFAMFPTTTEELMAIADSGNIMPPKSTWFEPKLLSGLFIHDLK
ncbi:MAG: DUF1015 family protein [Oscillospiraceae bacterium]|jgi:uncharacterized protein (DUF1015 family)|nr:DUF1015 family protein [Oscillospiraceae bacterium]